MTESPTIQKSRQLPLAMDFARLRQEGLNYIEQLANELWTDYNTHDPGITILEALCYAITELGYRANFPITDLLANGKGDIGEQQPFFTPRQILTNEPYSLLDYRKLLIDLKGVNNAWIIPALNETNATGGYKKYRQSEVPLYPECKEDRLVYKTTHHAPIDMRGLYHVRLDLDNNDQLGDLNSSNIDFTIYSNMLRGARMECILPRYNEVDISWLSEYYNQTPESVQAIPLKADQFGKTTRWRILLVYKKGSLTTTFEYETQPSLKLNLGNFETLLEQELQSKLLQQQIMGSYFQKTMLIRKLVQTAWETLHAHRNLCEDWWTVDTIRNTPIGFCADVEVRPEADIEKVYAEIIVAIEQYLNPAVRFYSLRQLMDKKVAVEDIFEGPKLEHGFLLTDEVEAATLRQHIYTSDLINIIMDIDGVVGIRNVLLTKYDDKGNAILPSQKWCVHIDDNHKPVLDLERSKLLFFKNQLPFRVKSAEAFDTILYLRGLQRGQKIVGAVQDLLLPNGQHYELWRYSSIQHDLPDTYGIGMAGLPETATDERRMQARQLKAYLMFYDQLLAGFFSQLYHARDLLGLDTKTSQSYFQQLLNDWKHDEEDGIKQIDELYTDKGFLQKVLAAPVAGEAPQISIARQRLMETDKTRYDRRNRFLDHLIARFAESFNEYVLTQYISSNKLNQQELIDDKIRFIQDYPASSSRRGTAFNILGESWNTSNISGLQNRLARLSGINDPTDRNLFCLQPINIVNEGSEAAPKYNFFLQADGGKIFLVTLQTFEFIEHAERMVNEWYENLLLPEKYVIVEEGGTFTVNLHSSIGDPIAKSAGTFISAEAASAFISELLNTFKPHCDEEGMHLVEHSLLRPLFEPPAMPPQTAEDVYQLFNVCLPDDCLFCGEEDPYSFRVTIAMPCWPQRFRDFSYRRFFETLARREAPAHVHVKVCWLSFTDMQRFEHALQAWRKALKAYRKDQLPDLIRKEAIRKASNELMTVLNQLNSVYPEATLHDCDEGTTNPVRLGNTNLGSL